MLPAGSEALLRRIQFCHISNGRVVGVGDLAFKTSFVKPLWPLCLKHNQLNSTALRLVESSKKCVNVVDLLALTSPKI